MNNWSDLSNYDENRLNKIYNNKKKLLITDIYIRVIGKNYNKINLMSENKLISIEARRFISAFAILIVHYQHFAYENDT